MPKDRRILPSIASVAPYPLPRGIVAELEARSRQLQILKESESLLAEARDAERQAAAADRRAATAMREATREAADAALGDGRRRKQGRGGQPSGDERITWSLQRPTRSRLTAPLTISRSLRPPIRRLPIRCLSDPRLSTPT